MNIFLNSLGRGNQNNRMVVPRMFYFIKENSKFVLRPIKLKGAFQASKLEEQILSWFRMGNSF